MSSPNDFLWLLIAYLAGSIPTAYLVAKRARGIDIREHGSGNVGAANVFRVVGKGWGAAVLSLDILKGWISTAVLARTSGAFPELPLVLTQFVFGFAAIVGHTWTPWLNLRGGKGVAAGAGSLLGIFPLAAFISAAVWAAVFLTMRYVSLASIAAAAVFPILLLLFYRQTDALPAVFAISLMLSSLLIFNHRQNISRLRQGSEPRVSFRKT